MAERKVAPPTPDEAIAEIERDEELMRQVAASIESVRRGEKGVPLKDLQAKRRAGRTA